MKKGFKVLGVIALGIGLFATGGAVGASSDWQSVLIADASSKLGKAGYAKKEELIQNADIASQMKQLLDPAIQAEQEELTRLLEEYYRMKLNNLQDTPEYQEIEGKLETLRNQVFERYRVEIDAIFAK